MVNLSIRASGRSLTETVLREALQQSLAGRRLSRVLLLPPDMTRLHSYAGKITALYYEMLRDTCRVDILPAIGTHDPMSAAECAEFFGPDIPGEAFLAHDWRGGVVKVGQVPGEFVEKVSEGLLDYPIDIEINRCLLDPAYDLIISIGQVVPHEVAGMANYSKNILVGCGGPASINRTHFLGAVYGMERLMGRDHSPVRQVFDYAEEHFLKNLPLVYVLTVTTVAGSQVNLEGLFIGRSRSLFENAVALSQERNLIFLDRAPRKVVTWLDEREFKSTWVGNKAIYRTRMAIADGGELLILAPGVRKFGEDPAISRLVEKYGYVGRNRILEAYKANDDLRQNLSAAAHLIHGSSDGRFAITYAVTHLTRQQIEGVGFRHMPLAEALARYDPQHLDDGCNTLPDGEEIYFIRNPAVGLWADRKRFRN